MLRMGRKIASLNFRTPDILRKPLITLYLRGCFAWGEKSLRSIFALRIL